MYMIFWELDLLMLWSDQLIDCHYSDHFYFIRFISLGQ
jgi:hypothetical protein